MVLAPFYRNFDLPWEGDPESSARFRRYMTIGLVLFLLLGLIIPFLKLPAPKESVEQAVPERLARLMTQEKPKPPPPPPPPKPIEPPKPETKPTPVDRTEQARKKAEKSLSKVKDELADLRRTFADQLPAPTQNLTGAVGADSKAERSLITSKAGSGSAGVQSTNSSRGFGSGAGSLTGHTTTAVSSSVGALAAEHGAHTGANGKAGRSQEEIELVFDRNKGAIYALYSRELREHPELQGKMVLQFTIAPSGEITDCHVVSSELNDPELERKIVARVKLIRFDAKDVAPMTTTKPIEFFPG